MLREHLIDDLDYFLIPEEAWNKLLSWYGVVDGQVSLLWFKHILLFHCYNYHTNKCIQCKVRDWKSNQMIIKFSKKLNTVLL